MTRPARVIIDLNAARTNLRRVRELAPQTCVMAVIKADAYGHGLTRMARAFAAADAYGVACFEEAQHLRDAGVSHRIVLLEGVFDAGELAGARTLHIDVVVHTAGQIALLERCGAGPSVNVWMKIDTGMHRLGLAPEEAFAAWQRLRACPSVHELRLMTHLANAQHRGDASVARQLRVFEAATAALQGERCIANSAALIGTPAARADWVRPGIMLYGVSPFDDSAAGEEGLRPVMTLRSALIAVNRIGRGEAVGYGSTWSAPEIMDVGVVAMGYGDGYPRHAASGTPVLVNGRRAALIGRPSMDMLIVDLRNVPGARVGDPVVLWGTEGDQHLPVEEIARHAGTIAYQLLCSVKMRARFEFHGQHDDTTSAAARVEEVDSDGTDAAIDDGIV